MVSKTIIPEGYKSSLNLFDTQVAIGKLKRIFEDNLAQALELKRVSAPLFIDPEMGINDNLSGVERPVSFDIPEIGRNAEIVHSLAKWKRIALQKYDFRPGRGIYTDMNAIRRDEELSNIHSIYVDQWDWEKVILREERTEEYLKDTVNAIVGAVCDTLDILKARYPQITTEIRREVSFVTSQELLDLYPDLTGKEREDAYLKEHKTAFIMKIGGNLSNGEPHDSRAPDYDDWELNGDIMFWNDLLGRAFEISSMGIRVDETSLDRQLTLSGCDDRRNLTFHKMLLNGELPLTMGGGIGQSRLSMLILGKAHIGEVQVSLWDEDTVNTCKDAGIILL